MTEMIIAPSINGLIEKSVRKHADLAALGFAFEDSMTYRELQERILLTAAQLRDMGVKKGDRIAILAENSPNWGTAYLGIVKIGAVAVPILPDFPEADVKHVLTDCKAKILFTTQKQLEKIYDLKAKKIKKVITLDDNGDKNRIIEAQSFSSFLDAARSLAEKKKIIAQDIAQEDDLASIIYTSGTSGHSKAVMLSHKNFCANVLQANSVFAAGIKREGLTFLSILPVSHAFEFTASFLFPLSQGARVVYAGKTPTPTILERICKEERPNVICLVPMVIEKIYKKKILPAVNKNLLLKTALKLPVIRNKIVQKIGAKLANFFGGNLFVVVVGGAALNLEVEKFLHEAQFPYLAGYGLSEAAPIVSGGPFGDPTLAVGCSGKPVQNMEVKIVNKNAQTGVGEIYVKGPNVMPGYQNNPEATAETIIDGWLATGDLGYLDEKNNLFIEGRSKSVIVLSHGENIYPETIEEKINAFQHVVESLVIESHDKLEAQIYLDYELIDGETKGKSQQQKLSYIEEILHNIKTDVNSRLPHFSQLTKVNERQEPFIKTATHKIKRYLYTGAK